MQFDEDKIDEMTLALLYLVMHDESEFGARAWKGFDWDTMNRLHEKGFIANPIGKAKSVGVTPEGCKKAKHNRTTFYQWLKNPEFKAELDRQRDEIAAEAFGVLSQSLTKAVEVLVGLLGNKDDRLKRLAAKDIIDFIIRHKENEDLDKRLAAIEQRLGEQK